VTIFCKNASVLKLSKVAGINKEKGISNKRQLHHPQKDVFENPHPCFYR